MPKTIMIDGYNLDLDKGTGVATYARNLSLELHNLGYDVDVLYGKRPWPKPDPFLREIAFFDPADPGASWMPMWLRDVFDATLSPFGVPASRVPVTGRVIAEQFRSRMPHYDRLWNAPGLFDKSIAQFQAFDRFQRVNHIDTPDVMHWTYPMPARIPGARNIYTMHDLVPLRLPYTTLDVKERYLRLMRRLVRDADHIVTVSEASRRDIVELLGCPDDKVTNTYQSAAIPAKYAEKPEDELRRELEGVFDLTYRGYFLFFGSIEPKKNIGRLIEAYLASRVSTPLVIIGAQAWKSDKELRLVNEKTNVMIVGEGRDAVTKEKIRLFEYAPFPLLVSLIRGAKAVTFPSLYEGFGLPVLEAMQLGTPVLTSTTGSTPEVAGDAALSVDPYDVRAISQALIALDDDAELRGDLAARGLKQAQLYSPERYRARLRDVYDRVLAQAPKR